MKKVPRKSRQQVEEEEKLLVVLDGKHYAQSHPDLSMIILNEIAIYHFGKYGTIFIKGYHDEVAKLRREWEHNRPKSKYPGFQGSVY